MNLTALRYFLEVCDCLSIRQASERLHVAASAVSRQISTLERVLDCTLLERHPNGVRMTEAGLRLERHARELVAHLELASSDIDDLKSLRRGKVRLAAVEGVIANFLPHAITEFSAAHPSVGFEVEVAGANRVLEAVSDYKCDLGLIYGLLDDSKVDVLAEYHQPLMAIVGRDHPLADMRRVTLKQAMEHAFVLPDSSYRINQIILQALRQQGIERKPVISSNNLLFLQRYAAQNRLVIYLPVQAMYHEIVSREKVAVHVDVPSFGARTLALCARKNRVLPHAAREFATFLGQQIALWEARDDAAMRGI